MRNSAKNGHIDIAAKGRAIAGKATLVVLLFALVFTAALMTLTGIGVSPSPHIDGVAEAASVWSWNDSTNKTLTFTSDNVTNYVDKGSFNYYGAGTTKTLSNQNVSYPAGLGIMWDKSDGEKKQKCYVTAKYTGGNVNTFYRITVSAKVKIWAGRSGGWATVQSQAMIMPYYSSSLQGRAFDFAPTGAEYGKVEVSKGSGGFAETSATITSNNQITVKQNQEFTVCLYYYGTNNRDWNGRSDTHQGIIIENVSFSATAVSAVNTLSTNPGTGGSDILPTLSKSSFYVDGDCLGAPNNFGFNSDESSSWGFTDWSDDDHANVAWLQINFSGDLLNLVKMGLISYYFTYTSDFDAGYKDQNSAAINFVGVHDAPTVANVSGSRSGDAATWQNLGYDWTSTTGNWTNGNGSGTRGGQTFSCSAEVSQNATGIRVIFGYMADGALDGGFYNITLKLYSAFDGLGTNASPFQIKERKDFETMAHKVNGTDGSNNCKDGAQLFSGSVFRVENDIPMGTDAFVPIGKRDDNDAFSFAGELNGNQKTVSGLTVTNSSYSGLFGAVKDANIHDMTLSAVNLTCSGTTVGALVGRSAGDTSISNITVTSGSVQGSHQVGGIVGYVSGGTLSLTNCTNNASVTATGANDGDNSRISVAGIVGYVAKDVTLNVENCTNTGNITATAGAGTGTGGIVGYSNIVSNATFNIKNCSNSGAINGKSGVGGIVGYAAITSGDGGGIVMCKNTGTVYSTHHIEISGVADATYLGGIVGDGNALNIKNCYNSGTVSTYTGSATGSFDNADIVGGIAGYSTGNISNVYNSGLVGGANNIAGIVGNGACTISYAYSDGTVAGYWDNDGAVLRPIVGSPHAITYSWRLAKNIVNASNTTAVTNFNNASQCRYLNSGDNISYYPETSNSSTHNAWTAIAESEDTFAFLRIVASISGENYLRLTHGNNSYAVYAPTKITSTGSPDSTTPFSVTAYYADIKDAKDELYVRTESIGFTWESEDAVYDENVIDPLGFFSAPTPVKAKNNDLDNYGAAFSHTFIASGTSSIVSATEVKDAGTYSTTAVLYIGDEVVGKIIRGKSVLPRTITASWTWTDNTTEQTSKTFTYNGKYQGLSNVTLSTNWLKVDSELATFVIDPSDTASEDSTKPGSLADGASIAEFIKFEQVFQALNVWPTKDQDGYSYCFKLSLSDEYANNHNYKLDVDDGVLKLLFTIDPAALTKYIGSNYSKWSDGVEDGVEDDVEILTDASATGGVITTKHTFTFNCNWLGIESLAFAGVNGENNNYAIFTCDNTGVMSAVNIANVMTYDGYFRAKDKGDYTFTLYCTSNYYFSISGIDKDYNNRTIQISYTINPKPLDKDIDNFDSDGLKFGYNPNEDYGVINKGHALPTLTNYYDLFVTKDVAFGSGDPMPLLYYYPENQASGNLDMSPLFSSTSIYLVWTKLKQMIAFSSDYKLSYYVKADDPSIPTDDNYIESAKDITVSGNPIINAINDKINDESVSVVYLYLKYTGNGNYSESIYVRMAIMAHDYGRDDENAPWGTESNPFLIKNEMHLLRLVAIVNGTSQHGDSVSKSANANGTVARDITYAGAYFRLEINDLRISNADITDNTSDVAQSIKASEFAPIGSGKTLMGVNEMPADGISVFSGTFDGGLDTGDGNTIHNIFVYLTDWTGDYAGLFGYLKGATIKNLTVNGTMNVTSRYAGGVAGYAENSTLAAGGKVMSNVYIDNHFNDDASYSGQKFNDDKRTGTGGLVGYMKGGVVYYHSTDGFVARGSTMQVAGVYFVGGLFGVLDQTYFVDDTDDNTDRENSKMTALESSPILGSSYVGGIAGLWIIAPTVAPSQTADGADSGPVLVNFANFIMNSAAFSVSGGDYVGGIAGYLDGVAGQNASEGAKASTAIKVLPYIKPIGAKVTIQGTGFVGGLFGVFEGGGYKQNSDIFNDGADTRIVARSSTVSVTVSANDSDPYAMGGLFGYLGGGALVLGSDINISSANANLDLSGDNGSQVVFAGNIAGIIGNNGSIESISNGGTAEIRSLTVSGLQGKAFVGGIAGLVAYSAGTYQSGSGRVFGANANFKVDVSGEGASVSGQQFVGGMFGAIGKIDTTAINWTERGLSASFFGGTPYIVPFIKNIMNYGSLYESAAPESVRVSNKLNSASFFDWSLGENGGATISGDMFVGGVTGYVGSLATLDIENPAPTDSTQLTDLPVVINISSLSTLSATGNRSYFGGVAGYVEAAGTIASRVYIDINGANGGSDVNYVGGIFGYMTAGTASNNAVAHSAGTLEADSGYLQGKDYVGGIAGYVGSQATLSNNYTSVMGYSKLSALSGGIAGNAAAGSTITNSWAYHLLEADGTNSMYTKVNPNHNGKYILVSNDIAGSNGDVLPTAEDLAVSANIIGQAVTTGFAISDDNAPKEDMLSFAVTLPSQQSSNATSDPSRQVALYNALGDNKVTENRFDCFVGSNTYIYFRLAADQDSMIIVSTDIVYKGMKSDKNNANKTVAIDDDEELKRAYRPPTGNSDFYWMKNPVQYAYDGNGVVTAVSGEVHTTGYKDGKPSSEVILGYINQSYTAGSADAPYTISTIEEWRTFASAVRGGTNYEGQTVQLLADIGTVDLNTEAAGGVTNDVEYPFRGTFDGNGYSIEVKYSGNGNGISLFAYAKNGTTIKNLTIKGTIDASVGAPAADHDDDWWNGGAAIGAFVGTVNEGTVTFINCTNEATVKGRLAVGGLVGAVESSADGIVIVSCTNKGKISSTVGLNGNMSQFSYGTGGLIGYTNVDIIIESCRNAGDVTGGNNVGGVIGLSKGPLEIYNCANTGEIFATLGDSSLWETNVAKNLMRRYAYAGGIVGKIGGSGSLQMYASYNSGTINATGNIGGGLVGSIGEIKQSADISLGDLYEQHDGLEYGGTSNIAYCYNTGDVKVGTKNKADSSNGMNVLDGNGLQYRLFSACGGGIVGLWGDGSIKYCYNVGTIRGTGYSGAQGEWQIRLGGIAGQSEPQDKNNATTESIFAYCYNVGQILIETVYNSNQSNANKPQYGGGISGYTDSSQKVGSVKCDANCYTLQNCLSVDNGLSATDSNRAWKNQYGNFGSDDGTGSAPTATKIGTIVTSLTELTAYLDDTGYLTENIQFGSTRGSVDSMVTAGDPTTSGNGKYINTFDSSTNKVTYDENFIDGTLNGYIFIYGCLPTLAMFALDTYSGLSMLSVAYGRDEYGDYVGVQAGSKESPYIIKDGIDMLGFSALTNASAGGLEDKRFYTFHDKYVEIAHSDATYSNNMDNENVTSIDMSTLLNDTTAKHGKNYYLYAKGAAGGGTNFHDDTDLKTAWEALNHSNDGTGTSLGGATFADLNFIPLGYLSTNDAKYVQWKYHFAGSFDGRGASIDNLRITRTAPNRAYAAVFARTQDASISNLTVNNANITAIYSNMNAENNSTYSDTNEESWGAIAGGIVAWAGGDTVISGCKVTESTISATAGDSEKKTSHSYAGGIVGLATTAKCISDQLKFEAGVTVTVQDCEVSALTVTGYASNIGGIAGMATGTPRAHAKANGAPTGDDASTTNIEFINNTTGASVKLNTEKGATHADAFTGIGGVVGVIDGVANVTLDNNSVTGATITGNQAIGGMVGISLGKTSITGAAETVSVGKDASISITGAAQDTALLSDINDLGTALGGIVGYGAGVYFGNVKFEGKLEVNTSDNAAVVAENIGGIIGYMGDGTVFQRGSKITVTGSIIINTHENVYATESNFKNGVYNQNIGGVVGLTRGAVFSGEYDIQPTMSGATKDSKLPAHNVGGFIGKNLGKTYINSDGTTVNIGGSITGVDNVGGFVGLNAAEDGGVGEINIGLDNVGGEDFAGLCEIHIGKYNGTDSVTATGKNVGGFIGFNERGANSASITIQKGRIYNYDTVQGMAYVGGVVGNSQGLLSTGGSVYAKEADEADPEGDITYSVRLRNFGEVSTYKSVPESKDPEDTTIPAEGVFVGGVIGYLDQGTLAGYFTNVGNVSGIYFVGGSVGYVGSAASITVQTNSNGDLLGDTMFSNYGNVKGTQFVGGAVGATMGTIIGEHQFPVSFRCSTIYVNKETGGLSYNQEDGQERYGSIDGKNYLGGVIGILAGNVTYGRFINNCKCKVDVSEMTGAGSIGGAIGMVGVTDKATDWTSKLLPPLGAYTVKASTFEYDLNTIDGSTSDDSGSTDADGAFTVTGKALGVGGIIGVITAGAVFANTNNFFATGNVVAKKSDYVGGIVGFVLAVDANLRNILLDHTEVSGNSYVGGVVGAAGGKNLEIANSFNIHGTVESTVNEAKYRGGIIGGYFAPSSDVSADDIANSADLSTCYWMPRGRLDKASDKEEPLTSDYIQGVVDDGTWLSGAAHEHYNIGSKQTGWLFLVASDMAMADSCDHTDGVHTGGYYKDEDDAGDVPYEFGAVEYFERGGHEIGNLVKYWKRIANNYSITERDQNLDTEVITSAIIAGEGGNGGGEVVRGHLYAAASSGVPGRFLAVSHSTGADDSASANDPGQYIKLTHSSAGLTYTSSNPVLDYKTYKNAVTAGSYGFTYIDITANTAVTPAGAQVATYENHVGNIAIYYRKAANDDTMIVDLGSAAYDPKGGVTLPELTGTIENLITTEFGADKIEKSDSKPAKNEANAGKYVYYPRYAQITASDAIKRKVGEGYQLTAAGVYEGYLDIYLYDSAGTPKPVGSVPFVYEITPAVIQIAYVVENVAADYYDGNAKSTVFNFSVETTTSKTTELSEYMGFATNATVAAELQGYYDLLNSLNLYYVYIPTMNFVEPYFGQIGETVAKFDPTTFGNQDSRKISFGNNISISIAGSGEGHNALVQYQLNGMQYVGRYGFASTNAQYVQYKYDSTEQDWVLVENGTRYVLDGDGNYVFKGNVGDFDPLSGKLISENTKSLVSAPDTGEGAASAADDGDTATPSESSVEYPVFEITKNELTLHWETTQKEYNGENHTVWMMRFEAEKDFATADALKQEFKDLVKDRLFVTLTGGTSSSTSWLFENNIDNTNVTTSSIVFSFSFGANAGTYTAKLEKGNNSTYTTNNCVINVVNDTGTFTIYPRKLTPQLTYVDGGSATSYEYNAQQHGVKTIKFDRLVSGDNISNSATVKLNNDTNDTSSYTYSSSAYTLKADKSKDAGTYNLTITLSGNYQFGDSCSANPAQTDRTFNTTWTITKYKINISGGNGNEIFTYDGAAHLLDIVISHGSMPLGSDIVKMNPDGSYTITPFANEKIKLTPSYGDGSQAAVNVGTYTLSINGSAIDYEAEAKKGNYDVTVSGGSGTIEIIAAKIGIEWGNNQFTYDGKWHCSEFGTFTINNGCDITAPTYDPTAAEGPAVITVKNAFESTESITIKISGAAKDAGTYAAEVASNIQDIIGTNASKDGTVAGNYELLSDGLTSQYTIARKQISFSLKDSSKISKVYDGNPNVLDPENHITFTGLIAGESFTYADFMASAVYDNKDVGNSKNITYNVSLKADGTVSKNYTLSPTSQTFTGIGEITARQLTLTINGSTISKVYDGSDAFGGSGVTSTSGISANSNVYRAGNGFKVDGFVESGITITAAFKETGDKREAFDAFVNNIGLKEGETSNKKIVFTCSSSNYELKLGGSSGFAWVDNNDNTYTLSSNTANAIQITRKSIRASYKNTLQSYVTADNKFNTDWKPVEATLKGVEREDIQYVYVAIENNWMYKDNAPAIYNSYTTIRGSASSNLLRVNLAYKQVDASKDTEAQKLAYQNYTLRNFPTLVIGYFVDDNGVFTISSLASLLIATYYYSASGADFELPKVDNVKEELICTADQYAKNENVPDGYTTWEDYIAHLRESHLDEETISIERNDEGDWCKYTTSPGGNITYTKFKLTSDISGVFTDMDITLLDNMFIKVTYGENGNSEATVNNSWGYNPPTPGANKYLANVLYGHVGDVVTFLDHAFDNFTGEFDGNGYVIDGVNIMGGALPDNKANAGFFATLGDGAVVKDLHLRNLNVIANGVTNVGGLAGASNVELSNVSVHGVFTVSGVTNVGGVVGSMYATLDKTIALGTINAKNCTYVGGVVGSLRNESAQPGTVKHAVSLMYIWAKGATTIGGISANGEPDADTTYRLMNALWKDGEVTVGSSTPISYDELYGGSIGGYGKDDNSYYLADAEKGTYDVLDDHTLNNEGTEGTTAPNPRQSMRLCDIIDVYLLLYDITPTTTTLNDTTYNIYNKSATSWLVGAAKGTKSSPIVIANQQNVSLLRELRFATFKLTADVYMYSTYTFETYKGAFFGNIYNNTAGNGYDGTAGYHIYIKGYDNKDLFESMLNAATDLLKAY